MNGFVGRISCCPGRREIHTRRAYLADRRLSREDEVCFSSSYGWRIEGTRRESSRLVRPWDTTRSTLTCRCSVAHTLLYVSCCRHAILLTLAGPRVRRIRWIRCRPSAAHLPIARRQSDRLCLTSNWSCGAKEPAVQNKPDQTTADAGQHQVRIMALIGSVNQPSRGSLCRKGGSFVLLSGLLSHDPR